MTFDISSLKKISAGTLGAIAAKEKSKTSYVDTRFWTPTRDGNGNGRAIIRILPSIRAGELPWTEQWSYAIHGPNGWYIETSRRTINQQDPMAEYIAEQWKNAVSESDKASLRSRNLTKARHTYIANILVINDPEKPENNGTVKLWRFGQKIYEMITDMAKPDPFDETKGGVNVTDWENGCNFKMIIYTKDGRFPSYDKSSFDVSSSIGDDQTIVNIADKMYDLGEFNDPAKIKSYDELKQRVDRVFGVANNRANEAPRGFESPVQAVPQFGQTQQVVKPVLNKPVANTGSDKAPWDEQDIDYDQLLKDIA